MCSSDLIVLGQASLPDIEVGELDRTAINVARSTTSSLAIQPAHVNAIATPQRSHKDHVVEALTSKGADVSSIIAVIEVGRVAA